MEMCCRTAAAAAAEEEECVEVVLNAGWCFGGGGGALLEVMCVVQCTDGETIKALLLIFHFVVETHELKFPTKSATVACRHDNFCMFWGWCVACKELVKGPTYMYM